jgi:hypothetical protein
MSSELHSDYRNSKTGRSSLVGIRADGEKPLAIPSSADTPVDVIDEPHFRRIDLLHSALSLREPDAGSAAILWNKFHTGFFESGYESLSGFGATTNVSLGSLQSLDRRCRYAGVFGQVILRPAEQRPRRFDLAN